MLKRKILIIEDAVDLGKAVGSALSKDYHVEIVNKGDEALSVIPNVKPDLILLDINLPGLDGFSIARSVRTAEIETKIIAMTARDGISDKLKGFELGFDDYVTKPFDMRELMARIRVVLDRDKVDESKCYSFKGITIDPRSRTVRLKNNEIDLTKLEFDLLYLLAFNSPAVVEQATIIDTLWDDDADLVDPPVRSHIKYLRKMIGDKDYTIIKTIPGVGYKIEEVKEC